MKLDDYIERLRELEEREPLWQRVKDILSNLVFSPDSAIQGAVEAEDWNALLHEALVRRAPGWYYEQIATAAPAGSTTSMWTFETEKQAREMKDIAGKYGTATLTMNPPYTVLLRTLSPLPEDVVEELNEKAARMGKWMLRIGYSPCNDQEDKLILDNGLVFVTINYTGSPEGFQYCLMNGEELKESLFKAEFDERTGFYVMNKGTLPPAVSPIVTEPAELCAWIHRYAQGERIPKSRIRPQIHTNKEGAKEGAITIGRLTHGVLNDTTSFPTGTEVVFLKQPRIVRAREITLPCGERSERMSRYMRRHDLVAMEGQESTGRTVYYLAEKDEPNKPDSERYPSALALCAQYVGTPLPPEGSQGHDKTRITIGRLTHGVLNDTTSFPTGTEVVFLRQPLGGMYTAVPYSYYATGTQFEEDAKKAGVLIQAPAEDFEIVGSYTPDEAAKHFY